MSMDDSVVYVGDEDTPYMWLEEDPGYDHLGHNGWGGHRYVSSCKRCRAQHTPMYGFDNAGGEYEALYICVECMMDILGVVEE